MYHLSSSLGRGYLRWPGLTRTRLCPRSTRRPAARTCEYLATGAPVFQSPGCSDLLLQVLLEDTPLQLRSARLLADDWVRRYLCDGRQLRGLLVDLSPVRAPLKYSTYRRASFRVLGTRYACVAIPSDPTIAF